MNKSLKTWNPPARAAQGCAARGPADSRFSGDQSRPALPRAASATCPNRRARSRAARQLWFSTSIELKKFSLARSSLDRAGRSLKNRTQIPASYSSVRYNRQLWLNKSLKTWNPPARAAGLRGAGAGGFQVFRETRRGPHCRARHRLRARTVGHVADAARGNAIPRSS